MFPDAPRQAFQGAFPNTAYQTLLKFKTDYESLEGAAGITIMEIGWVLWIEPSPICLTTMKSMSLNHFFSSLKWCWNQSNSNLYIEHRVSKVLRTGDTFYPGLAMVTLENNWVKLSSLIQASVSPQGIFGTAVDLYDDSNNEIIRVDSIHYPILRTNIALLQYHCGADMNQIIRMAGVESDSDSDSDSCYDGKIRRTTRINGPEGLCIGAEYIRYVEAIPIVLNPCGDLVNQKWTFLSDGTIQAVGRCLTFSSSNSVVICDCSQVEPIKTKWKVSHDGTITNPDSGLVLTSNAPTSNTKLTMEANIMKLGQGWRVGSYVKPVIASIIGLKGMCLEATKKNTNLWLENCVKNKAEQTWALYGDGSVRVNNKRNLCVSSPIDGSPGLVSIIICVGASSQRWFFTANDTILNPKTGMVLGVEGGDVSLKKIILQPTTGKAEQEWGLFY